jgi:hypothetical protein
LLFFFSGKSPNSPSSKQRTLGCKEGVLKHRTSNLKRKPSYNGKCGNQLTSYPHVSDIIWSRETIQTVLLLTVVLYNSCLPWCFFLCVF